MKLRLEKVIYLNTFGSPQAELRIIYKLGNAENGKKTKTSHSILRNIATTKDRYKQSLVYSVAKKKKIHGISVLFFVSHHFTFNNIGRKKSLQSNNFSFAYYFWG